MSVIRFKLNRYVKPLAMFYNFSEKRFHFENKNYKLLKYVLIYFPINDYKLNLGK